MNRVRFPAPIAALGVLLCAPLMAGAKRDLADYAMRVVFYGVSWHHDEFGYHGSGHANLFDQQGIPRGAEFTCDCQDRLTGTAASEAYPAKWKKPGQSVEVVFGEVGQKLDEFHVCELKVAEKKYVFYSREHVISRESPEEFLAKHKSQTPTVGPATPDDVPVSAIPYP